MPHSKSSLLPIVILISGNGSNLQAIIDAVTDDDLSVDIRAVISNNPNAYGLQRAERAGIPIEILDHHLFSDRDRYDRALSELIQRFEPKLVVLAGFMRILSNAFVHAFNTKMINIHPSLLPKFKGLHTHKRALEAAEQQHGASVHYVTAELDGGPVILQAIVPVLPDDNAQSLAKRVLEQEHIIYPMVISWFAAGRLTLRNNQIYLDNKRLDKPLRYNEISANPDTPVSQ